MRYDGERKRIFATDDVEVGEDYEDEVVVALDETGPS